MDKVKRLLFVLRSTRGYSSAAPAKKAPTKRLRTKISTFLKVLGSPEIDKELQPYRARVIEATELVVKAKEGGDEQLIKRNILALKRAKEELQDREYELMPPNAFIDQMALYDLLSNRFFFDRSYSGHPGLIDLGPLGVGVKNNIIKEWRKHFISHDHMLEVECPSMTPADVLKASGHVDKFTDYVVRDVKTNEVYRADHLVKEHLELLLENNKFSSNEIKAVEAELRAIDTADSTKLQEVIQKYRIKSKNGNELSSPSTVNLMFAAQLGAQGIPNAYLRPETSQGIFLNFQRLFVYNGCKLPLVAAQIGTVYRNEIAPKHNLFRLREFTLCEIEHFYHGKEETAPGLEDLLDMELVLWSSKGQQEEESPRLYSIREALRGGVIKNKIIGYYLARGHLFLAKVGVNPKRLRFRQHRSKEMAHYAEDCWDAEALTSHGWVEIAGFSDRSSYDLKALSQHLNISLDVGAKNGEVEYPKVVEPSFGVGRILQTVLEHSFHQRNPEGEPKRPYFLFPPAISPVHVTIYPIVRDEKFNRFVDSIEKRLEEADITFNTADNRYSIGKRYARNDETGIPFGITLDDETEENGTVTLREIKTMEQIRVKIDKIGTTLLDLIKGKVKWSQLRSS